MDSSTPSPALAGEDPFDEQDYRRWEENGVDLPPDELAELRAAAQKPTVAAEPSRLTELP